MNGFKISWCWYLSAPLNISGKKCNVKRLWLVLVSRAHFYFIYLAVAVACKLVEKVEFGIVELKPIGECLWFPADKQACIVEIVSLNSP